MSTQDHDGSSNLIDRRSACELVFIHRKNLVEVFGGLCIPRMLKEAAQKMCAVNIALTP